MKINTAHSYKTRSLLPVWLCAVVMCLSLLGCIPYEEEVITEVSVDFSNPEVQKVYDYQDRQMTDSLLSYFGHKDPTYRFLAAKAFGSIQNDKFIPELSRLLEDPIEKVRCAAAFAIGQIRSGAGVDPLVRAFDNVDSLGQNQQFNGTILEAVGKCGNLEHLRLISTVENYSRKDSLLLAGQSRSIFQFAERGIVAPEGTAKMIQFLQDAQSPKPARVYAAHYLKRAKDISFSDVLPNLIEVLRREKSPEVRMSLAPALAQTRREEVQPVLLDILKSDPDYRVRCNVIQALGYMNYEQVKEEVRLYLSDRNIHVGISAGQFFIDFGRDADATKYRRWAKDTLPWQVQMKLYHAANRHIPLYFEQSLNLINYELKQRFSSTENPHEKAACLLALAELPWNYKVISEQGLTSSLPLVRTSAVKAIGEICAYPDFDRFFGISRKRVSRELAELIKQAIQSGDVGQIAEAADIIVAGHLPFRNLWENYQFVEEALEALPLPQAIESYYKLQEALAYLKQEPTPEKPHPKFNHPINWALAQETDNQTRGIIETEKGDIVIEFFALQTPGTVANFIQLAKNGYFNGKTFHRVVPNFVVQDGCPRGDGYGSLDYTIRSEFTPLYYDQAGRVGMASAGKDTECTQFFITHSPTPHLDGRYTLFGKVVEGMDIVHKLQVGDQIKDVDIQE